MHDDPPLNSFDPLEPGYLVDDAQWVIGDLPDVDGIEFALEFDGTGDYAMLGNDATLQPGANGYSFATWVKIADTGGMTIASFGYPFYTDGSGFELIYGYNHADRIELVLNDGVIGSPQVYNINTSGLIGDWHHIAFSKGRQAEPALQLLARIFQLPSSRTAQ